MYLDVLRKTTKTDSIAGVQDRVWTRTSSRCNDFQEWTTLQGEEKSDANSQRKHRTMTQHSTLLRTI